MLLSEDVTAIAEAIEPGNSPQCWYGELMGGTVCLRCSPFRRSAGGQWPHPDPGPTRSDRG